jgi:putative polyketide hydroxylase
VFLVGDAAHTIPPVGAFGLSTGIADGYNLAWKLAMVMSGQAGAGLLDSYEAERLPIARFAQEQTVKRFRNLHLQWATGEEAARARAELRIAEPLVLAFGYQYEGGAVIGPRTELPSLDDVERNIDGHPGTRLPHGWIDRKGERISTLDVAGSGLALLTGPEGQAWQRAADTVLHGTGIPLSTYRIGTDADADLVSADDEWVRAAGLQPDGALLVRPDNVIAWRSPTMPADPAEVLRTTVRRLLDR